MELLHGGQGFRDLVKQLPDEASQDINSCKVVAVSAIRIDGGSLRRGLSCGRSELAQVIHSERSIVPSIEISSLVVILHSREDGFASSS